MGADEDQTSRKSLRTAALGHAEAIYRHRDRKRFYVGPPLLAASVFGGLATVLQSNVERVFSWGLAALSLAMFVSGFARRREWVVYEDHLVCPRGEFSLEDLSRVLVVVGEDTNVILEHLDGRSEWLLPPYDQRAAQEFVAALEAVTGVSVEWPDGYPSGWAKRFEKGTDDSSDGNQD